MGAYRIEQFRGLRYAGEPSNSELQNLLVMLLIESSS